MNFKYIISQNPVDIIFKLLFIVIMGTGTMSCIEEVDPKGLINNERKVVVNSFISPQDSIISAEVSLSRPIIGFEPFNQSEDSDIINDALVSLSNGTNSVILLYNQETFRYELDAELFKIEPGEQYFLEVEVDSKTYTAQCTVPSWAATEISLSFTQVIDELRLRVLWQDEPNVENYYRVLGEYKTNFNDNAFFFNLFFDNDRFKQDVNRDGLQISADADLFGLNESNIDSVRIQLLTTDKNYYNYQKTVFDFDGGDDPFQEPVRLISNIEGENALGIFAAYQSVVKEFRID